jgi:DNA polymerase III epsilon subunit-like protein
MNHHEALSDARACAKFYLRNLEKKTLFNKIIYE